MIAVSDTSPINYLVLIGYVDLLGNIYEKVVLPRGVLHELHASGTPAAVRAWLGSPPNWLEVSDHASARDISLELLDDGEREAIMLAQHLNADRLILDDAAARREAIRLGIPVVGLLGILAEASHEGWIELSEAINRLHATNFHMSDDLAQRLLNIDGQKREQGASSENLFRSASNPEYRK